MYKVTWVGNFRNLKNGQHCTFKLDFVEQNHDDGLRIITEYIEAQEAKGWELESNAVISMEPIH